MSASELPLGTVTFLFTDIEGSTNLARTLGEQWTEVLEEHHAILRAAIRDHDGIDIRTEGDAFFAVFRSAVDAVAATADAQRALAGHTWPADGPVRVRMGLHTGEGRLGGGPDYVGLDVHRAARIAAAGHGAQVLISEATKALAVDKLPDGVALVDLGEHRLKDFDEPQRIHQLVIEGLVQDFPPLRTLDVPTNLPHALTTFVGRERELDELVGILLRSRLITLVGPGGTGKTRLAIEVASRTTKHHPDGVYFIDLSPIRDPQLVPSSVVQALGLKELPDRPALETIKRHLADRESLLVMDNFEQVLSAAPVVEELLDAAPRVTAVVTSRIRLDLMGEQAFPVPPLRVPEDGVDPDALATYEAVALFLERARAALPSFDITADNADAVAKVCARLDGLPLAIELAAAQLRVLSANELLIRLEHRLPLRTGAGNVPERQRTLRGVVEWSYQLLEEHQRRLFARLSVFAAGATLAAIDEVANPSGDLGADTLEVLGSLFDQSLIRRDETIAESRFTMLETIREYAEERLQAEFDASDTERRHAEFFAAFAEEWGPAVRSPRGPEAVDRLARDHENIRAAIAWSLREDRADVGSKAAASMWMFWVERGHLAEGKNLFESLLNLQSIAPLDRSRAAALSGLGALLYWGMDYEAATAAYRQALDIRRSLGDAHETAQALTDLAYSLLADGEPAAAMPLIEEGLTRARQAGDEALAVVAGGQRGLAQAQLGDYEAALASLEESLTWTDKAPSGVPIQTWVGEWMGRIGSVLRLMGRLDEADERLRESLVAGRRLAGNVAAAAVTWQLAAVASEKGEHERALVLAGFSEGISERIGGAPPRTLMLLPDLETLRTAARSALDEDATEKLWETGKAMSVDEAIDYALGKSG